MQGHGKMRLLFATDLLYRTNQGRLSHTSRHVASRDLSVTMIFQPQLKRGPRHETNGLRKKDIRGGQLTLTIDSVSVDSVSLDSVRVRMAGFAHLGSDFATADAAAKQKRTSSGYEPQMLGFLEFDRRKERFTRFDLVALGDTYGQLGGDLKYLYRPGRHPLGVVFELVPPDAPVADRTVPPRGMRFPSNYYSTGG